MGGSVRSEATGKRCGPGFPAGNCRIDVVDTTFDDSFVAVPDEGYYFVEWQRRQRGFCGGSSKSCDLSTEKFAGNPDLLAFLESDDEVFFLEPVFAAETDGGGGSDGGGGDGGGGGSASGAADCFNANLLRDGTKVVMSLRTSSDDGIVIADITQEAFEGASYKGQPARQLVSDLEGSGASAFSARLEFFIQVDEAKKRVKNLYSKNDIFAPEAATIEISFDPPQLERFDLTPGQSYSQTYVVDERTTSRGQSFTQSIEIQETATYVGRRTITVPAGTFETCLFEEDSRTAGPFPIGDTTRSWYGVGNGVLIQEVAEDGSTTTLLSAKINGKSI